MRKVPAMRNHDAEQFASMHRHLRLQHERVQLYGHEQRAADRNDHVALNLIKHRPLWLVVSAAVGRAARQQRLGWRRVGGRRRPVLASAGADATLRLWHPATGRPVYTIPLGMPVHALLQQPPGRRRQDTGGAIITVGLGTGILSLDLDRSMFPVPGRRR